MPDYIVHKAVNADAVRKANQRSLAEYGRTFEAQRKYDGCCAVMTLHPDGTTLCQSRTGEVYPSLDLVASELSHRLQTLIGLHGGLVLIGEAWWPGKDQFSIISGEFRRGVPSDRLQFIVNDVLTLDEFRAEKSDVPYRLRRERWAEPGMDRVSFATSYTPGSYGCPQALCNELVDAGGYDGLILRDPEGVWEVGRGTSGEIVKIKRVLSYDLRCIGIEQGRGKHAGRMGALQFDFNGKILSVGTGYTDAQRQGLWDHWGSENELDASHGPIGEIEAMDLSSEGLLREPRFKGWRFDKPDPDILTGEELQDALYRHG